MSNGKYSMITDDHLGLLIRKFFSFLSKPINYKISIKTLKKNLRNP